MCFTCISISSLTDSHTRTLSFTHKTAYTAACRTHYTIPVRTTLFLKMNPRVRNAQKTWKFKNKNIDLEKVHFVGLYFTVILQRTVQETFKNIFRTSLTDHSAKYVTGLVLSNQFLCLELACNCNAICRYQAVHYVSSLYCTGKRAQKFLAVAFFLIWKSLILID